ncbi:MAG: CPBP family intramembrane metalloprotease [Candidatus Micrarchaeota archaeon]|nr:CPBP family intramembrane metalloprotease [Candidatus Micrarchaeota archaeon]
MLPALYLGLSLLIFLLPFALLLLERKKPRDFAKHLSIQPMPAKAMYLDALKLFAKTFAALYVLLLVVNLLGFLDTEKVAEVLRQQEPLALLVAVSFGPLAEELFFRGYLQKRVGVLLTSAVFAFLHRGYGSVAEVLAAFVVSMIFGHYVRKNNSILPPFIAHALYNAMSVLVVSMA